MPRARRARVVLCSSAVLLAGAAAPAGAGAQQAPAPAPTLTAAGSAQVKPVPADRNSDTSIRKAVDSATAKALPLAVADARAHAAKLAAAAGVGLGALVSISDTPAGGYPFLYSPQNGTFGNGRFCGQIRRFKTVTAANGSRRRVALKGTRKVCRVPGFVTASVSLTYAATP